MTRKQTPADETGLKASYREHGDAEPDSGLDRIILARAEQAVATPGRRGPAPWIAGLATAGAVVLAIGVVVVQTPPSTPSPVQTEESAAPAGEVSARALRSAPAQPQGDAARSAPAVAESAFIADLAETAPDPTALDLQDIRELLAAGQTEAARSRLEQLMKNNPDLELPDELHDLLDTTSD